MPAFAAVLVPVDFSNASRRAADAARDLVPTDAILLLHVVPGIDIVGVGGGGAAGMAQASRELGAEAEAKLAQWGRERGGCATRVEEGVPADAILKVAALTQPDLVVLGAHGMGGFKRRVLGSVAGAVSRKAETSVLLVR